MNEYEGLEQKKRGYDYLNNKYPDNGKFFYYPDLRYSSSADDSIKKEIEKYLRDKGFKLIKGVWCNDGSNAYISKVLDLVNHDRRALIGYMVTITPKNPYYPTNNNFADKKLFEARKFN